MRESSIESSAIWTRDDTVTSSLASVILHACSELCVRFWNCQLVRYDNANMIPRMMIRHHPSLTGYNIPHAIYWCNRICFVQLKVLVFEGSSHTWTYRYSNDKWSVIVELSLQTRKFSCVTCLQGVILTLCYPDNSTWLLTLCVDLILVNIMQLILDSLLQRIWIIYIRLDLIVYW